jgi:hypothetical protein
MVQVLGGLDIGSEMDGDGLAGLRFAAERIARGMRRDEAKTEEQAARARPIDERRDQAMLTFDIRSRFQHGGAWRAFLREGCGMAVIDPNSCVERRDPEFIRDGDVGRHFPTF